MNKTKVGNDNVSVALCKDGYRFDFESDNGKKISFMVNESVYQLMSAHFYNEHNCQETIKSNQLVSKAQKEYFYGKK